MKQKSYNTRLAILLLAFTIVSVFGFDYLITQISESTGKATSNEVRVSLFIEGVAEAEEEATAAVTGGKGGSSKFQKRRMSLEVSTPTEQNIHILPLNQPVNILHFIQLLVKNTGEVTLNLEITNTLEHVTPDRTDIRLRPGEETSIGLQVLATTPEIYTGKLIFSDASFIKELPIVLTVLPTKLPYTVDLTIPPTFKVIQPGKEIFAQIKARTFKGQTAVIHYILKDMNNNILHEEQERLAVQKTLSIDKTIKLPDNAAEGDYAFIVTIDYQGNSISATDTFTVSRSLQPQQELPRGKQPLWIILLLIILILVTHMILKKKTKRGD